MAACQGDRRLGDLTEQVRKMAGRGYIAHVLSY